MHLTARLCAELVREADHVGLNVKADNRPAVASYCPAPVQVSFHDVTTSGLAAMDAWISDAVLHPTDTAERFTEQLRSEADPAQARRRLLRDHHRRTPRTYRDTFQGPWAE